MARYTLVIGNQNYSSWSLRAWLLMSHYDIPFEQRKVWLRKPDSEQQLKAASGSGKVPVLLDNTLDGAPIWDTMAIALHLAHEHPNCAFWPSSPKAKAFAYSASAEMHSSFFDLRGQMPMNCKRRNVTLPEHAGLNKDVQRVLDLWEQGRLAFAQEGPFLAGPFSVADVMFAPVVWRFATYLPESRCSPEVLAYCKTMRELPSMQRWEQEALAETEVLADCDALGTTSA